MMTNSRSFIGSRFDQICFVVEDLDESVAHWRETNGVERWDIVRGLSRNQLEKEYWGKPGNFEFSCAYGFAGDTLIELAHHDGGESIYADWIRERGYGLHHIGFRLQSSEDYHRAATDFNNLGYVRAMGALVQAPGRSCRWSYFDTRAQIGCYTELYYVEGEGADRMQRFKRGEVDTAIDR